jgi:type IV pilus assembly protein PilA
VELMAGGKTPLSEFYADKGRWPAAAGSVMGTTVGKYVSVITISTGAGGTGTTMELTATFAATGVNANIANQTVELETTNGGQTWTCRKGTINDKYLPGACR